MDVLAGLRGMMVGGAWAGFVATGAMVLAGAGPAPAPAPTPAPNPVLDRLLAQLQVAPDEAAAQALELRIHEQWRGAGSPAAKLLLEHGVVSLQGNVIGDATASMDAALDLEPDYAEAYSDRAAAELGAGQYDAATRDAGAALLREPRHFDALRILSHVAEARHDWKMALDAWQRALVLSPRTPDAQPRLNLLRRNAEGEPA